MHALVYRDATLIDVPAIVRLVESGFRGVASRAGWTTEADLLDGQRTDEHEVRGLIEGSHSHMRLAHQSDNLVACVRIERTGDVGYLGMITVAPLLQSKGIGRSILAEAERVIYDSLGLRRARMTVIGQRTTLIDWYIRRGYRLTGERRDFPYDDVRCGLPRRMDLYFEVLEKELLEK